MLWIVTPTDYLVPQKYVHNKLVLQGMFSNIRGCVIFVLITSTIHIQQSKE